MTPSKEDELLSNIVDPEVKSFSYEGKYYSKSDNDYIQEALKLIPQYGLSGVIEELRNHSNQWRVWQDKPHEEVDLDDVIQWYDNRIDELTKLKDKEQ